MPRNHSAVNKSDARSPPRETDTPALRWRNDPRIWSALIVLLVCISFAPLFTSDFTNIDDLATIAHNPKLNPPTLTSLLEFWDPRKPQMDLYVPVTYTVWSVVARTAWLPSPDAAGIHLNPWMFHGINVALHALSALVVFQILRLVLRVARPGTAVPVASAVRTEREPRRHANSPGTTPIAAAGALLFALHPVQVEPVGWASGTKDVLYGLFSLIALWGYLRYALTQTSETDDSLQAPSTSGRPGPGPRALVNDKRTSTPSSPLYSPWYWFGTAAFILAMLSKPTAIVTPLIAAALDLLILRRRWRHVIRAIWPWLLLTVPVMIEGRFAQPAQHAGNFVVPPLLRPLISADALSFYLYKLLWPARLAFIYNHSPQAVIAHGWLWWTWIVPVAAMLAVVTPFLRRKASRQLAPAWPAAALAIFCFGVLPLLGLIPFDFQQFSTTADHYLYLSMLGPALAVAFALDGCACVREPATQTRPGWRAAERGDDARRIFPVTLISIALLAALGLRTFFQARHWHDSISLLQHAIEINPWSPSLYDNLSMAYADEHLPDEARRWDEESVRRWPARAASHLDLASDLASLNRPAEAEAQFEAALRLDPTLDVAREKLADLRRQRDATTRPKP